VIILDTDVKFVFFLENLNFVYKVRIRVKSCFVVRNDVVTNYTVPGWKCECMHNNIAS